MIFDIVFVFPTIRMNLQQDVVQYTLLPIIDLVNACAITVDTLISQVSAGNWFVIQLS